jgi:hypothetical protein
MPVTPAPSTPCTSSIIKREEQLKEEKEGEKKVLKVSTKSEQSATKSEKAASLPTEKQDTNVSNSSESFGSVDTGLIVVIGCVAAFVVVGAAVIITMRRKKQMEIDLPLTTQTTNAATETSIG